MEPEKLLLIVLVGYAAYAVVESREYHDVMWNSRFFNGAYRENIINVRLGDQLSIICPKVYHAGSRYEYSKIYWVNHYEHSKCLLFRPKWVGVCANQNETTLLKMTFRSTNPIPGGMEFEVGKMYYIISTSSGDFDGIDQIYGGLCSEKKMKLAIWVGGEELPSKSSIKHDLANLEYEVHEFQQLVSSHCNHRYIYIPLVMLYYLVALIF